MKRLELEESVAIYFHFVNFEDYPSGIFIVNLERTLLSFLKCVILVLELYFECWKTFFFFQFQAKKKLLQRQIHEMERSVQNLISEGLKNFSSRLVELDLVVKTPIELLSKSTVLAEQHQELENKMVRMEIEIYNLEEKYKNMVRLVSDVAPL